jgi:rhodanese-related sulfurtransferase
MFERIDYQGLRRLVDDGAQLVEVLPADEYAEEHLPGAITIPLKQLDADSAAQLAKSRPAIVYCWDYLCDMSVRAAARLVSLGFERDYDYAPSKADYLARGSAVAREPLQRVHCCWKRAPIEGLGRKRHEAWSRHGSDPVPAGVRCRDVDRVLRGARTSGR